MCTVRAARRGEYDADLSWFQALTGDDAPEPITESQNGSSTCWPTEAKQNDLSFVTEYRYDVSEPTRARSSWLY